MNAVAATVALAGPGGFVQPDLDYARLAPLLVVFGAACLGVVVEAFVPRARRFGLQSGIALVAVVGALGGTLVVAFGLPDLGTAHGLVTGGGAVALDGPAVYLQAIVLVCAVAGVLLFSERRLGAGVSAFAGQAAAVPGSGAERRTADLEHTEVFPLLLFAVAGMMLFPAANDLLLLFVALEVLSLPLYLLTGLARRRRLLSQEAALKYFLLGAFASAFFLYGAALVYGATGTMQFATIWSVGAQLPEAGGRTLLLFGIALMAVGVLFKVGAVPFQAWTPDVYQGAPTPLVAFMAAATKVAAFGALLRLFYVAFGSSLEQWRPMLWAVAIASMALGAVVALVQTDVKRMLGYSAIAHAGFVLTGVVGLSQTQPGVLTSTGAVLFYLPVYAAAVIGAFALVGLVRDPGGEATGLASWEGLGRRSPLFAVVMAIFLLSLAGVPPTAGFIAKWSVISAAGATHAWSVVAVAIVASLVALVSYLRVLVILFFREPTPSTAAVTRASVLTTGVIAVCAVVTMALGVVPGPLLDLVVEVGTFVG